MPIITDIISEGYRFGEIINIYKLLQREIIDINNDKNLIIRNLYSKAIFYMFITFIFMSPFIFAYPIQ